jgi:hypothetical protein
MDKESIRLLQNIDCNCNDCIYMTRDIERHKSSQTLHHKWQLDYFNTIKNKVIEKGKDWISKGENKKGDQLMKEADVMKFQYENTSYINYGNCEKYNKSVSFIPNTCQLETQQCFQHRRS